MKSCTHLPKIKIYFEIIVLYLLFPLLFLWDVFNFPIMLLLLPVGIGIYLFLKRDHSFDNKLFINWANGKKYLKPMLVLSLISAGVMLTISWMVEPANVFILIKERLWLLLIISVFYPLFSVVPQALAYRALFFHRYAYLFGGKWMQLIVSALLFSFGHILYKNWLVLLLTFVGGLIYSYRYLQSKSLALNVLEHSIYGVWLFASGLGMFFISSRV
ncbi:MAG: CPBP family intramembrane metalloprotease [Bacteroidales bacterium]|nr:CPBP family intramembrane metalloprotease [Bacteroidales bacterium]